MRKAGDLVRPERVVTEGVVRTAVQQKVLEEAHILQTEERDLVLRLVVDEWRHRVLALQARLETVTAGRARFLTLDTATLAVEATTPRLGVAATLETLVVAAAAGTFVAAEITLHVVMVLLLLLLLMVARVLLQMVGVVIACEHHCRLAGCTGPRNYGHR